jgi:hypothetical protein
MPLCPLCGAHGAVVEEEASVSLVSCVRCSDFSMTRTAAAQWKLSRGAQQSPALLMAWKHMVRSRKAGELPVITLALAETCLYWARRSADTGT